MAASSSSSHPSSPPSGWRLVLCLLGLAVVIAALAFLFWPRSDQAPEQPGLIFKVPGRKAILLTRVQAEGIASGDLSLPMPGRRAITRGAAEITNKFDRDGAQRELAQLTRSGGTVRVQERPIAVMIEAPIVKQLYRNNSETAALEMLLATRGVQRGQAKLQRLLERDGPLDPRTRPDDTTVWGDPELGFVGRVEGGGVAGGFGVYPPSLTRLASRWIRPVDLSGSSPAAIFERLLSGHAVLAWVGLSAGPYASWTGPRGEAVRVNFGEHTVLLVGLAGGRVLLNDPLTGEAQNWSRQEFKRRWNLLGRRAISA